MNFKKVLLVFATIVLSIITAGMELETVKADIQNVSVTPLVEGTDSADRFEISAEPNSVKTLKLSVTNFGLQPVEIKVKPTNATTSPSGEIGFDDSVAVGNYGLKYAFSSMTEAQSLRLKKNQTKDLTFKVKLPSQQLSGTVIGGFDVYDTHHPNDGHSGVGVYFKTNKSETSNQPLKFHGITAVVHGEQPYLNVDLANYNSKILKDSTVQIKIKKNNWYNKLGLSNDYQVQDMDFKTIAPNSKVPIEFDLKQTPVIPGRYLVEGSIKRSGQVWHFKENVKVSSVAANLVNQASKNLIYDKTGLYVTIIGILSMIIILIFWGISYQRR